MITAALMLSLFPATVGDVFTVGPSPQDDYVDLQTAIDSVPAGADLRLASGVYANDYFIDNKSLTLSGGSLAEIQGSLVVSGIAANQTVILRGLEVRGQVDSALVFRDSDGLLLAEDCEFVGGSLPGVRTHSAGAMVLNEVQGKAGSYNVTGSGLSVSSTEFLTVHESTFRAGVGSDAARINSGTGSAVYIGGSYIRGGGGAHGSSGLGCGGNGGDGLDSSGSANVIRIRDTITIRGSGGPGSMGFGICGTCVCNGWPGMPVRGPSIPLGGPEPEFIVPTEVTPGQSLAMTVSRELGDDVYVSFSSVVTPQDVAGDRGILYTGYTGTPVGNSSWQWIGSLTSSSLTAMVQVPTSAVSSEGLTYAQTAHFDPIADRWLYGPLRIIAVRTPVGPPDDLVASVCNGDGGDQLGCTSCPLWWNNASPGTVGGCENSTGSGARLHASGSHSVSLPSGSASDLRFSVSRTPAQSFCRLVSGSGVAPDNPANPCFGMDSGVQATQFRGLRCAINGVRRHGGRPADAAGFVGVTTNPWGGESSPPRGIAQASGFVSGETRYFQVIYRDLEGCCAVLNTTQAIRLTFTP